VAQCIDPMMVAKNTISIKALIVFAVVVYIFPICFVRFIT